MQSVGRSHCWRRHRSGWRLPAAYRVAAYVAVLEQRAISAADAPPLRVSAIASEKLLTRRRLAGHSLVRPVAIGIGMGQDSFGHLVLTIGAGSRHLAYGENSVIPLRAGTKRMITSDILCCCKL